MERARKLANRAILKRLVSQSKQSRSNEIPLSMYRPSRLIGMTPQSRSIMEML